MPLYEYRCQSCDHRFEILQRMGDGAAGLICPQCGEAHEDHLARQLSTFASSSSSSSASPSFNGAGGPCGGGGGFT